MYCHTSDLLCDARKETIKCTIKSVANASQGMGFSGGHISPGIHCLWKASPWPSRGALLWEVCVALFHVELGVRWEAGRGE